MGVDVAQWIALAAHGQWVVGAYPIRVISGVFFLGLLFYVHIKGPNPKRPRKPLTPSTENPDRKKKFQTPTLKPQTTINEKKWVNI